MRAATPAANERMDSRHTRASSMRWIVLKYATSVRVAVEDAVEEAMEEATEDESESSRASVAAVAGVGEGGGG